MEVHTAVCLNETHVQGFTQEELGSLEVATVASAFLSFCGSSFLIVTYHMMRTHKPLVLSLLYYLSIADFMGSLTYIVDGISPSHDRLSCKPFTFCIVKAATHQMFNFAAMLWTGAIALNLHLGLVLQFKIARQPKKFLQILHLCIWSTSAAVTVALVSLNSFGRAGQWCWIKEDLPWARLLTYYLPLVFVLVYNTSVFLLTHRTLVAMQAAAKSTSSGSESIGAELTKGTNAISSLTKRMRILLVVFVIVHSFSMINRLYDLFSPDRPSFFLSLLQSLSAPLQGLGNSIAYSYGSSRIRRIWGCSGTCCWFFLAKTTNDDVPNEVLAETVLQDFATPTGESLRPADATCPDRSLESSPSLSVRV